MAPPLLWVSLQPFLIPQSGGPINHYGGDIPKDTPAHVSLLKRTVNYRIPGILRTISMMKTMRTNHKMPTMNRITPSDLPNPQRHVTLLLPLTVRDWGRP